MLEEFKHSGYINIGRNYECKMTKDSSLIESEREMENPSLKLTRHYAYDYSGGKVVIHAFERIPEICGQNTVLGYGFDGKPYLFCSQIPVQIADFSLHPQNYTWKIEFAIKGYEPGSKYTEAVFSFDELQYFCPSSLVLKDDEERNVIFSRKSNDVKTFDMNIDGVKCHVRFVVGAKGKCGIAHFNMEAITEIRISFPATDDLDFLHKIYSTVDLTFAFICNRRNTTCLSMKLNGKYPSKAIDNGNIVDCEKLCLNCEIFYYDKYREEAEEKKLFQKFGM